MNKITVFTLGVALLDCWILPFILGCFYPGYSHKMMVLSTLGSMDSPVRKIFNLWMACMGIFFIAIGIYLFLSYRETAYKSALILLVITVIYAVFDCLVSSLFSAGSSKEMLTLPQKIHDYGSAIGCTIFLFAGLVGAIMLWRKMPIAGYTLMMSFIVAVISFIFFIIGEDIQTPQNNWEKLVSCTGVWQRISLTFMYIPYIALCYFKS